MVTGAGLEPAPPARAGALTVKLPCSAASPAVGSGNLDMSDGVGHLGPSSMSDGAIHTEPRLGAFRMSDGAIQGVRPRNTGFCFFRGGFSKREPSHFS